jgi:hypothetical protein
VPSGARRWTWGSDRQTKPGPILYTIPGHWYMPQGRGPSRLYIVTLDSIPGLVSARLL